MEFPKSAYQILNPMSNRWVNDTARNRLKILQDEVAGFVNKSVDWETGNREGAQYETNFE
jgi:chitinase